MRHPVKARGILLLLFALLFGVSAYMVVSSVYESHRQEKKFARLQSLLPDTEPAGSAQATDDVLAGYAAIHAQNPDFFGWVRIEQTALNYPVMYTPDAPSDYLHRAFDRSESQSGVPFLAEACTEEGGHYLIYGHNMKNGTMFAPLLSYAQEDFYKEHPIIQFDTLQETGRYAVLAAFYTEIYPASAQDVFRYEQYTDLRRPELFQEYLAQAQRAALYDTGVRASYGDQILTLSTCSYHTENGRFVVVAVQTP